MDRAIPSLFGLTSPRAIAFSIKGLYAYNRYQKQISITRKINVLANRLKKLFLKVDSTDWSWFENKLTYANAVLPEAMLLAFKETNDPDYRSIALKSFDFLLSKTFIEGKLCVISNRGWMEKGQEHKLFGEQPIDVAYTIIALDLFAEEFNNHSYEEKLYTAFNWFLGDNRIQQVVYNAQNGSCYDALEEGNFNLNQGAESTVCYLISRMKMEKRSGHKSHVESGNISFFNIGRSYSQRVTQ